MLKIHMAKRKLLAGAGKLNRFRPVSDDYFWARCSEIEMHPHNRPGLSGRPRCGGQRAAANQGIAATGGMDYFQSRKGLILAIREQVFR